MIAFESHALRQSAFAGLALIGTVLGFGLTAQPSEAAPAGAYYSATLATPLAAPQRLILEGTLWSCAGDTCVAQRDTSRDVTVCGRLSRKVGPLANFATPAGTLAEQDLARCNTH